MLIVLGLPTLVVVGGYVAAEYIIDGSGEAAAHLKPGSRVAWAVIAGGTTALLLIVGHAVNGELFGALIDGRNRYSLARLQLAGWTVLVLSCWLAIVIARIAGDFELDVALKVGIPAPVVAALGLSVGSFALSTGIKDAKRQRTVAPAVPQKLR